jgi:predicted CopG family antitoxin
MGTRTISFADDAYERLKRLKREDESFSDVVRRLTGDVTLSEYYGVLDEETAAKLESVIESRREHRSERHRARVEDIVDRLEEGSCIRRFSSTSFEERVTWTIGSRKLTPLGHRS